MSATARYEQDMKSVNGQLESAPSVQPLIPVSVKGFMHPSDVTQNKSVSESKKKTGGIC